MHWIFRALPIALFLGMASFVGFGQMLPASRTLERELVIEAERTAVYAQLASIRNWKGWYVPPDVGRIEGPEIGAGGRLILADENSEELRQLELVETSSPARVRYRFPEQQTPYRVTGTFLLEALDPHQTKVISRQVLKEHPGSGSWIQTAGERWFLYIFVESLMGAILQRELENLAKASESGTNRKQR